MSVPATRVLAFPGIDLESLTELRARASDAFLREDYAAYQDACMMIRKLIGGQDFRNRRRKPPRKAPTAATAIAGATSPAERNAST
ncbi:MAG TPA: hypothetical protein VH684_27075 [Xanthobacteraceae bacterium]|jgi:hypothetical protein